MHDDDAVRVERDGRAQRFDGAGVDRGERADGDDFVAQNFEFGV